MCPRGGIYGTTMYIGHPIHKALGAKIGYSLLNGVVYFVLFCSGIFASLYNVIPLCRTGYSYLRRSLARSTAFEATPARHYPALLLGVMPFIANKMSLESQGNHSYDMGIQMMSAAGGTMCASSLPYIACLPSMNLSTSASFPSSCASFPCLVSSRVTTISSIRVQALEDRDTRSWASTIGAAT